VIKVIVIDSHEPPEVFQAFEDRGIPYIKAEIKFFVCNKCKKILLKQEECCGEGLETIKAGDFTNTNRTFLVERKTMGDFVGSMLDKSLHDQAAKMARVFAGPKFVFLDGFISVMLEDPHNEGIKNWIRSMRVTLAQFNVFMWQFESIYEMIYELNRMDEKMGVAPKIHMTLDDKYTGWSDQKKIVCKLLDVSDKKADKLLEYFKTPWNIFASIVEDVVMFTKTGKPKLSVDSPFNAIKGFGINFVVKNKEVLMKPNG
jgi:ERCC4-type nuclease